MLQSWPPGDSSIFIKLGKQELKYAYFIKGKTCSRTLTDVWNPQTGAGLSHDMHYWTFCQTSFTKNAACATALAMTLANQDFDTPGQIWQPLNCKTNQLIEIRLDSIYPRDTLANIWYQLVILWFTQVRNKLHTIYINFCLKKHICLLCNEVEKMPSTSGGLSGTSLCWKPTGRIFC